MNEEEVQLLRVMVTVMAKVRPVIAKCDGGGGGVGEATAQKKTESSWLPQ